MAEAQIDPVARVLAWYGDGSAGVSGPLSSLPPLVPDGAAPEREASSFHPITVSEQMGLGPQTPQFAPSYGLPPLMPMPAPRPRAEMRNLAPPPQEYTAPIAAMAGPPIARGATAVGSVAKSYLPWMAGGAAAGGVSVPFNYQAHGHDWKEGVGPGMAIGALLGASARAGYGAVRRPPTGGHAAAPVPDDTWARDLDQVLASARTATPAGAKRAPLAERVRTGQGGTVYDDIRAARNQADDLAGPMPWNPQAPVRHGRLVQDGAGRWRNPDGTFAERPGSIPLTEGFNLDELLAARRR